MLCFFVLLPSEEHKKKVQDRRFKHRHAWLSRVVCLSGGGAAAVTNPQGSVGTLGIIWATSILERAVIADASVLLANFYSSYISSFARDSFGRAKKLTNDSKFTRLVKAT